MTLEIRCTIQICFLIETKIFFAHLSNMLWSLCFITRHTPPIPNSTRSKERYWNNPHPMLCILFFNYILMALRFCTSVTFSSLRSKCAFHTSFLHAEVSSRLYAEVSSRQHKHETRSNIQRTSMAQTASQQKCAFWHADVELETVQ